MADEYANQAGGTGFTAVPQLRAWLESGQQVRGFGPVRRRELKALLESTLEMGR
jgi:hypothetical protein